MDSTAQQDKPAPKRRRWPRRLAWLLVILIVLVVVSPLALALPFVRDIVADKASDALGREVTLEGASAFWTSGIDLEGVRVASPPGFDEPLATVDKVHVDVDLFGLIGGNVDATVRVDGPRVTLLKDAEGNTNLDGLGGDKAAGGTSGEPSEAAEPPAEERPTAEEAKAPRKAPRVHVEIHDGVIRAQAAAGRPPEEISALQAVVDLLPDGSMSVDFSAMARGAAISGKDVPLAIGAALTGEGQGPVEVSIPSLDLSKIASLVESATGIQGLQGTFGIEAKGVMAEGLTGSGTFKAAADGITLRTAEGVELSVGKIVAEGSVEDGEAGSLANVTLRTEGVKVVDRSGDEVRQVEEPLVELKLSARHNEATEELVVTSAELSAGRTLLAKVSEPWHVSMGDEPSAKGQLDVHVDLGRLSKFQSLVPQLSAVSGGVVGARLAAKAEDGLDIRAGIRVQNLILAPSELSPEGYQEKEILIHAGMTRPAGEGDVPTSIVLRGVKTSFLKVTAPSDAPLTLTMQESGMGAKGKTKIDVDLAALGSAFGGALGLEAGDRLGGTLSVLVDADFEGDAGEITATLDGQSLTLPASWAEGVPATNLAAEARVGVAKDQMRFDLSRFDGFGLQAKADAVLGRAPGAEGLRHANVNVKGTLEKARALVGAFMELPADARLSGNLEVVTQVVEGDGGRTAKGTITIQPLRWQTGTGETVLDEPKLEIRHDLAMQSEDDTGRYVVRELKLSTRALTVDVTGSATTSDVATALDATLGLSGDAAQVAGVLRNLMGEDYRDMQGQGAISGSIRMQGSTADGGETLLVNGDVKPGDWSVGGLTVQGPVLSLKRPGAQDPLTIAFQAGVNGGRTDVQSRIRMTRAANPWDLSVKINQLDTSPLLVDRGFGEYLKYALPTLLPANSDTPVLSGRLDTDIQVSAGDFGDPTLEQTLKGQGFIKMTQGSIGQSSLFAAVGGGKGLGQVGDVLLKAVPEVGTTLTSLSKSLNFSRMESHFQAANQVVNITKGELEGDRTHIDFNGTVGFDERVNLKVALELTEGKAAERLAKVLPSKRIPLKVTNTLSSPSVTPDISVQDLTAGALQGLIPDKLPIKLPEIPGTGGGKKNPLDGIKDLFPR